MMASSIQQKLVRLQWVWFTAIGLIFLLTFNGEWRMTTDSALYRELGRNLANGQGYVYLGEVHDTVYPGLPWLLAWSRQLFGQDLVPALILNIICASVALVLVYAMIRQVYPRWVAVAVVMITGLSYQLALYTTTVLNDVPFFLAVYVALYAQLRMCRARGPSMAGWLAVMLGGVWAAAMLRPAFWLLAASLVLWIGWEAIRGSKKRGAAMAIGLLLVGGAWVLLDIREGGGYEAKLMRTLANPERFIQRAAVNAPAFLNEDLSDAFFGMGLGPGLDPVLAVIVCAGGILLIRKHALWSLVVLVTLLVTVFFSGTTPRYYLMIMPLLALGWIQTLRWAASRVPRQWRNLAIGAGIALVLIPNLGMCIKLVTRQHGEPFLATYRHGKWLPYVEMAQAIRAAVPEGEQTIGPRASVLTFLSERYVVSLDDVLWGVDSDSWKPHLLDHHIRYAVIPIQTYKHISEKHRKILSPLHDELPDNDTDESRWYLVRLRYDEAEQSISIDSVVASGVFGKKPR